ncbi:MAG: helix-turn-helix domain-containing protein [Pseudomonadota bacterium]
MDDKLFNELVMSIKDAGRFLRGESEPSRIFHFDTPDIKAIRQKTGLSQTQFAYLIGVKAKTLQNWEQKMQKPTGTAAALFTIVAHEPEAALRALQR